MEYREAIKNCIFRFVSGSHAYGTNRPDSDIDYRGVFIAPIRKCFDLFQSSFVDTGSVGDLLSSAMENMKVGFIPEAIEQLRQAMNPEMGDLNIAVGTVHKPGEDEELQELRKFMKLAANCNPNIIEFLWVDRLIDIETPIWTRIRENRDLFLSKKARWTFSGYAHAQLKKIKTHRRYLLNPPNGKPSRKDFDLPERTIVSSENHGALLSLPEHLVSADMKQVVRNEKAYRDALQDWDKYKAWERNRNPKRQELERKFGYDCKHATHLIRLIRMAEEILTDGVVNVYRPDREELVGIINGAWDYEKVLEYADGADERMDVLYNKSALRHSPDMKKISELYVDICSEHYGIKL